ncbi:MAG: phytanoyl-CoA dioxygenase family protein [Xanthomonadales bacterium]|nr:phytanoyl-CoA dioxygenase family protein [Xanthomonadales bacterium]
MISGFTEEQIAFYHRNGYLIARGLASKALVSAICSATKRDLKAEVQPLEYEAEVQYPGSPKSLDAPGGHTVRRLKSVFGRDPAIDAWAKGPELGVRIRQLLNTEQPLLLSNHHNSIMTKQPEFSSHTGWHQDVRYWNYDRPEFVNAWLALGNEEARNGGMQLIPGTHRQNLSSSRYDSDKFLREDLAENRALIEQAVLAELESGDVLFFHANLFHMAGRNQTSCAKFALVFSFREANNLAIPGTSSSVLEDIKL